MSCDWVERKGGEGRKTEKVKNFLPLLKFIRCSVFSNFSNVWDN